MSLKIAEDDELKEFLRGNIIKRFCLNSVTFERINNKIFDYEKRFLKNESCLGKLDCVENLEETNLDRHRDVIFNVLNMVFIKLETLCCVQSFNVDKPGESHEKLKETLNSIFASNHSLADDGKCNNVRSIQIQLNKSLIEIFSLF